MANRFERVRRVLMWEAVAAEAKAKAAAERAELDAAAKAELAEHGTAPTWRIPDVGTVALPVSQETFYVSDMHALVEHLKPYAPELVKTRVEEYVDPEWLATLLQEVVAVDGVVCNEDGMVIPGLSVREGGRPLSLSFRPSRDAKAVAAAGAQRLLEDVERRIGGPVTLAEAGDGQA